LREWRKTMLRISPPLRFAIPLFVTLVVVLTPDPDALGAVPAGFGLGARAGVVTLEEAFWTGGGSKAGFGLDGFIRYAPSSRFVMSTGVTYGPKYHSYTTSRGERDLDRIGLYFEPRFELSTWDSPGGFFVGGRIGWEDLDRRKGLYAGATAGLTYFVSPRIGIEAAGIFNIILEPGDMVTYRSMGLTVGVVWVGL